MKPRMEYERNMNHSYLICRGIREENEYELQMLLNNQIPGLLDCRMEKVDGDTDLYYEITSRQSLERLYEKRKMNYQTLKSLLQSLYRAFMKMEEYLLSADMLLMKPEFVYADMEKNTFYFCVVPGEAGQENSLRQLLEFLLEHIDYEDEKAVATAYEWYKKSGEENYSFLTVYRETFEERKERATKETDAGEDEKDVPGECVRKENSANRTDAIKEIREPVRKRYIRTETGSEGEADIFLPEEGAETAGITEKVQSVVSGVNIVEKFRKFLCEKWIRYGIAAVVVLLLTGIILWKKNIVDGKSVIVGILVMIAATVCLYVNKKQREREEAEEFDYEAYIYEGTEEWLCQEAGETAGEEKEDESEPLYGETVFFKSNEIKELHKLEPVADTFPEFRPELFPFILGKLKGAVDGIVEHETVSRIHCRIEVESGEYYITDLNSTNGTVVNGEMLNINERRKLDSGDEVRIGQVVYIWK